jgi:hypothetical protein
VRRAVERIIEAENTRIQSGGANAA